MQTYSAVLRLAGALYNEVPKVGLTAAEIAVLRAIHGSDAVTRIQPGEHVKKSDDEIRAELDANYGQALRTIPGVGTLNALLGPSGVPLPKTVPGVDSLPPPKDGKRANKPAAAPSAEEPDAPPAPIDETEFS